MNVNAGCSGDGGGDLSLNPTMPPSLPHRDLGQGVHPGQGPCYKVVMVVVVVVMVVVMVIFHFIFCIVCCCCKKNSQLPLPRLLVVNPSQRVSATSCLSSPWAALANQRQTQLSSRW